MDTLVFGLDIGGTKTAGVFADHNGNIVGSIRSTGQNLKMAGVETLGRLITSLIDEAIYSLEESERPLNIHICAGIAGAGVREDRAALANYIQSREGRISIEVLPDTIVALEGAFRGDSGMLCISGTGSNVCIKDGTGVTHNAGGWGPLIGDPASATQLGMDAIRSLVSSDPTVDPPEEGSLLSDLILSHGLNSRAAILAMVYAGRIQNHSQDGDDSTVTVAGPASLARTVLAAYTRGDTRATAIVEDGIQSFISQIKLACDRISGENSGNQQYVQMGGLASHIEFSQCFADRMSQTLPDWRRVEPQEPPESGALQMGLKYVRENQTA